MKNRKLQNNVQFSKANHRAIKCKILAKAQYNNLSFQCLFRQGEKISTQIEMDHLRLLFRVKSFFSDKRTFVLIFFLLLLKVLKHF